MTTNNVHLTLILFSDVYNKILKKKTKVKRCFSNIQSWSQFLHSPSFNNWYFFHLYNITWTSSKPWKWNTRRSPLLPKFNVKQQNHGGPSELAIMLGVYFLIRLLRIFWTSFPLSSIVKPPLLFSLKAKHVVTSIWIVFKSYRLSKQEWLYLLIVHWRRWWAVRRSLHKDRT